MTKALQSDIFHRLVIVWVAFAALLSFLPAGCESESETPGQIGGPGPDAEPPAAPPDDIAEVRFLHIPEGMALVPAGLSVYGCDKDLDESCGSDDIDLTIITNEAFLIDVAEARWSDLRACVSDGACAPNDCLPEAGADEDLPAACAVFDEAEAFCEWAAKRMPTDLEWERAARGMNGLDFPWGDSWCGTCLNWSDDQAFDGSIDGYAGPAPVEAFPAGQSPYGALNLSGNLWELTRGNLPSDQGGGEALFARGGGFNYLVGLDVAEDATVYYRTTRRFALTSADFVSPSLGFRCAADPTYE